MYLTFDVGTTSMKTGVFNRNFEMVFSDTREYKLLYPGKNLVELPADFYWEALKQGFLAALASGISAEKIDVITITTQGETLIPIDKNGSPLCNAIIWLDARAEQEAAALNQTIPQQDFFRTTGLTDLGGAAPIAKLMWIRKQAPEIYEKTAHFLLLEDYLIYRLTGQIVSEHSLLSSSGYLDIVENCYWDEILQLAGVDKALLPPIKKCGEIAGNVTSWAAQETGLNPGTPVSTGAMDQIAGALGAGNIRPGIITETTGTCLAVAATAKTPDFDAVAGKFSIYRHFDDQYIYLPYNPTAAIILKWFKECFMHALAEKCAANNISIYQEMDKLAQVSAPGAKGLLLIPHFSGKLVPDFNEDAKGVFYGIGLEHTAGDFIRAVLEGVSYMLRENLDCLQTAGIPIAEIRSLGGGSRSDVWMQIKADICGVPFSRTSQSEAGSLGAAMLGALALGHYADAHELCSTLKTEKSFVPNQENQGIYEQGYQKYLALYRALESFFKMKF